jgi:hypothetical protein
MITIPLAQSFVDEQRLPKNSLSIQRSPKKRSPSPEAMSSQSPERFLAEEMSFWQFSESVDVICPKCSGSAVVARRDTTPAGSDYGTFGYSLTCLHCASRREVSATSLPKFDFQDSDPPTWLGFSLFRVTLCRGHQLWALSRAHCSYLRSYIAATLRERVMQRQRLVGRIERPVRVRNGYFITSRLPSWMVTKSARPDVLRGLDYLSTL